MIYDIVETHINNIRTGDTVLCPDGNIRTVCSNNIKESKGLGRTLFGDSYHCGNKPVQKLSIIHIR